MQKNRFFLNDVTQDTDARKKYSLRTSLAGKLFLQIIWHITQKKPYLWETIHSPFLQPTRSECFNMAGRIDRLTDLKFVDMSTNFKSVSQKTKFVCWSVDFFCKVVDKFGWYKNSVFSWFLCPRSNLLIVDVDLLIFFAWIWSVPPKKHGRGWHLPPHAPMSEATSMATLAADFDCPYLGKIFIPTIDFDFPTGEDRGFRFPRGEPM